MQELGQHQGAGGRLRGVGAHVQVVPGSGLPALVAVRGSAAQEQTIQNHERGRLADQDPAGCGSRLRVRVPAAQRVRDRPAGGDRVPGAILVLLPSRYRPMQTIIIIDLIYAVDISLK